MGYDLKVLLNAPDGEKLIKKVEAGEVTYQDALKQAARNVVKEKVNSETGAKLIANAMNKRRGNGGIE